MTVLSNWTGKTIVYEEPGRGQKLRGDIQAIMETVVCDQFWLSG
jgi:hypothetical protein